MKSKITVLVILLIMISSCTTIKEIQRLEIEEFSSDEAYMAINVKGRFDLSLKNLDTDEEYKISVKSKKDFKLQIISLPEGDYAMTGITKVFGLYQQKLKMHVPFVLKTILKLENNNILYLGDIHSTTKSGYNSVTHYINFDYKWEDFIYNLEDNYYFNDSFSVAPIEYMTLNAKDESNFKF